MKPVEKYQFREVVVAPGTTVENGIVTVCDGMVAEVSKCRVPSEAAIDVGATAAVPGLVNAHTHLEFSDLDSPLGESGMPFTQWLKAVIAWRIKAFEKPGSKLVAIRNGLAESFAAGVVAVGEIATLPLNGDEYSVDELVKVLFLERLSRSKDRLPELTEEFDAWYAEVNRERSEAITWPAISPHAPYSVHPDLLQQLVKRSIESKIPIAMHLAETREELEFLAHQSGPFVEFLESVGAWFPETYSAGETILDYLKCLVKAPRSLVIHGNYLRADEIEFIATNRERMSVVYCPRTHAYFDHETYPLLTMLDAGINVAIGTDSRASNPDLSVYEELKLIRQRFPQLNDQQILQLGTSNSAHALGLMDGNSNIAAIEVGSPANFNLLRLNNEKDSWFDPNSTLVPFREVAEL